MSPLKFFLTEKCSHCGERIEKSAKHCRHCGKSRANSWRKCTACGVGVAADSSSCWSCGANLTQQSRDMIFSDRWRREDGIFATRVTIQTPEDRLRHGIQVDEGTVGALYSNGECKDLLKAGYHEQSTFWARLTGGGKSGGFVESFLLTSDPVTCFVNLGDMSRLRSRENAPLEAALLVQVQLADASTLIRRLLPTGKDILRDDDLIQPDIAARIAEVTRRYLGTQSIEALTRAGDLRPEIEARLGDELPRLLAAYGLRFSGLVDIRLISDQIDREQLNESTLAEIVREQRAATLKRELENSHRLAEFKDEIAFKEQVNRWTHEFQLNEMERDRLVSLRRIAIAEETELAEAQKDGKVRLTAAEYEIQEKRIRDRYEAERRSLEQEQKKRVDEDDIGTLLKLREVQLATLERKTAIKTKAKIEVAQGTKDVSPIHVAGALGESVVEAIRASQPKPNVTVFSTGQGFAPMPSGVFTSAPSFVQTYAAGMAVPSFSGSGFEGHAQRYEPSVGICSMSLPGAGEPTPVGTAWLVAGRSCFVTNAHVAVSLLEAREQAGMSLWVTLAGQSTALPVGRILVHPNYALSKQRKDQLPTHDFAILHIDVPLPPGVQGLPLASRAKLMTLREMQSVGYLGFPFENLVGSVLLHSPKPTAQKGSIAALQPWDFSHSADPSRCQIIKHNLGVAGGASGSPLFDESGDVIGVITAGNMERLYDPQSPAKPRRVPSGVALNFAQRIDVLLDWMGW